MTDIPANHPIPQSKSKPPSNYLKPEDIESLRKGIPVSESEDDFSETNSVGLYTPEHKPRGIGDSLEVGNRNYEIRLMKDDYERQIKDLLIKLRSMQQEKELLERTCELQREKFRQEMRTYQEQTTLEIDALKSEYRKLQHEAPIIRERIDSLKEQLKVILVNEEQYMEIKRVPDRSRTLKDWVLVRVYEIVEKYKMDYENSRRDVEEMRIQNLYLNENLEKLKRDLNHLETSSSSNMKDLQRKYDEICAENRKIHMQLDRYKELSDVNADKAMRFDELKQEINSLLRENEKLENQVDAQIKQVMNLTKDREEDRVIIETKSKELDLITRDKHYLAKQNTQLQDKIHRLEERNDRLELETTEAKNAAQNYLNRLLNLRTETNTNFEEKFHKELYELRDRHAREMEEIKRNLNEIHERRVEYLKEAKEEAEGKLLRLEQDLKSKSEAYDALLLEHRTFQSRLEEQLSELRSELRLKSEQLERTHNVYEDTLNALRANKAENEMLRDKVDILRQEFYKSETKCAQENADLRAQLAVARENLQQYAMIEQELDKAIEDQDIDGFQAPTSAKRRIQQSLNLAKQLKEKQKLLEKFREENVQLKTAIEELESELALSKRLLSNTDQPYGYLVSQIEAKEREITENKRQLARLNQKYTDLGAQYDILVKV